MAARDQLVRSFQARTKRRPPRNFGVTGAIPGFGGYQDTTAAKRVADARARFDSTTTPRYGAQRAPYRPGERFKRKNPYKYGRGDASRVHRPRVD